MPFTHHDLKMPHIHLLCLSVLIVQFSSQQQRVVEKNGSTKKQSFLQVIWVISFEVTDYVAASKKG